MTVLVTGGTGFIGAELVRRLLDQGDDVVVAHRSGNFDRLADVIDHVRTIQADLGDEDSVEAMIHTSQPEIIHHFGATLTGPGEADPAALLRSNVAGVTTLLEAARAAGTRQVIFASSIGTYGRDLDPGAAIDDLSLQRPNTIYGVTKVFAENLGAWYRAKYDLDFRGLRYPSIVGPGVTTRSVAQYTSWMIEHPARGEPFTAWVEPDAVVPILYFKDAAQAAIDLSAAPAESIQSINYLVDGVTPTPTAGELADAVRRRLPDADIRFEPEGPPRALRLDDRAARKEWGWTPGHDLDTMIDDFLNTI
ncbi:MAG: SDR family NAD(P)-dependent oxidoreductase [Actinomycetota bacterium]